MKRGGIDLGKILLTEKREGETTGILKSLIRKVKKANVAWSVLGKS